LISCSSSISKIKVVKQTKSTEKQPHLPLIQNKFFTAQVNERHPIKTGADNYRIPTPLQGKKIAVVTNQSGVVLIRNNTENLADNKIQTHLVDFY
jgi:hypothetical protein